MMEIPPSHKTSFVNLQKDITKFDKHEIKSVQIVKRLLTEGNDIAYIMNLTGFSLEKILEIKQTL